MKQSRRKVCSVLLSIGIIASSFAVPSYAAESKDFIPIISAIDSYDNPSYMIGELSEKSGESPEKIVENNYSKKLKGSGNSKQKSYIQTRKSINSAGRTVISTIQTYNGFSVYGADQNFHINSDGVIECVAGSNVDDIENKVASKSFSAKYPQKDVINALEKHLGVTPKYETAPKPEIILYPISGKYHYVYKVEVEASSPCYISCTYYIDTANLSIITVNNHIRSIDGDTAAVGSGIGQSGETKVLNTVKNGSMYYLRNTVDNFQTCEGKDGWLSFEDGPFLTGPRPSLTPALSDTDNNFNSNETYQKAAVDAHSNVTKIIRFFKNEPFYRNSQEDNTVPDTEMKVALITNNPDTPYNEPIAWGSKNYLGFHFTPSKSNKIISYSLDVMAHEYSHGMLQFEGLTGKDRETFVLSEGIGDVFGVLAEYYINNEGSTDDWIMGEDIFIEGESWRRDSANPEIDDYKDYLANPDAPQYKAAGVITKAAALMALGGTHNEVTVNAIGYGKLSRIFYNAINDGYLNEDTSLKKFANYAVQSAFLLYGAGSKAYDSTRNAFISVGLLDKPPESFRLIYIGYTTIQFGWDSAENSIVGVYRRRAGTQDVPVLVNTTTSTTGLAINKVDGSWDYCAAYVNQYRNKISEYSSTTPINQLTTSAPTNLLMTYKSGLSVKFGWSSNLTGNRYAIYRKISGTNDEFVKVGETTDKYITVNTLPGKNDFKVAVIDSTGTRISPFTNEIAVEAFKNAPTNFKLDSLTSTTAKFSWDGAEGTRYAIYRYMPGFSDIPEKIDETQDTSAKVNLTTDTCDYQVAIVDSDGNRISKFSNIVCR